MWYTPRMTVFIREPIREWIARVEALAEAGGVTLDPSTFSARLSSGPAGAITPLQARSLLKHPFVTPEDFGAYTDDTHATETTVAVQAAIDYGIANGCEVILSNNAVYRTNDMLTVSSYPFTGAVAVTIRSPTWGHQLIGKPAIIHATNPLQPGLNIQGVRNTLLENFVIKGDSFAASVVGLLNGPDQSMGYYDPADSVGPGYSNTRWAPYAGLTIDALSGSDPGTGYPGKTYGQGTSSNVVINNVSISGFAVQYINFSTPGNGDLVSMRNVQVGGGAVGFAICMTQARAAVMNNCQAGLVHTCIDTRTYGAQNGIVPQINAGQWTQSYRLFNAATTYESLHATKMYCEAVASLGTIKGSSSAIFDACTFNFSGTADGIYEPIVRGHVEVPYCEFNGCSSSVGGPANFFNIVGGTNPGRLIFRGGAAGSFSNSLDFQLCSRIRKGYSRVTVQDSLISDGSGGPTFNKSESVDTYISALRVPLAQWSRWYRTAGTAFGYLSDVDSCVQPPFYDAAPIATASGYVWSAGNTTLTFTAGVAGVGGRAGEFEVGDLLYWRILGSDVGGSPDAPLASEIIDFVQADIPCLKVTAISGTTVTAEVQGAGTAHQLDTTYAPAGIYIAYRDWAPITALVADWTIGTNTMTLDWTTFHTVLQVGDFVMAGSGLAALTRVTAVSSNTITLSKNTTASKTAEPVYCSRFKPVA